MNLSSHQATRHPFSSVVAPQGRTTALGVHVKLWINDLRVSNSYATIRNEGEMAHFPLKKSKSMGTGIMSFDNLAARTEESAIAPTVITGMDELIKHLELMHDRCIARNLRAAGLGAFDINEEIETYGILDPNAKMDSGESMLIAAVTKVPDPEKQARYVAILLVEGADINETDAQGRTALMLSIERSYEKSAKALLHARKIDHYIADKNGWTALHYAANSGRESLVRLYIRMLKKSESKRTKESIYEHKEELYDIQTTEGFTAQQIAERSGFIICSEVLVEGKNKKLRSINKGLELLHHSSDNKLARRALKRVASFDSLPFDRYRHHHDDSSDEEGLLSNVDNEVRKRNMMRIKQDLKFDQRRMHSPVLMDSPMNSPGPYSPANISINVGVRVGESNRTAFFQSKSEMMKQVQSSAAVNRLSDTNRTRLPNMTRSPSTPLEQLNSNKQKLSDKIRNFLSRKHQNYPIRSSGSMGNLAARDVYESLDSGIDFPQQNPPQDLSLEDPIPRSEDDIQFTEVRLPPKPDVSVNVKAAIRTASPAQLNVRNRPRPKLNKMVSLPPIRNSHTLEKRFSELALGVEDPVQ